MQLSLLSSSVILLLVQLINAVAISNPSKSNGVKFKRGGNVAWDYENDIVRGVNLGGWFVLEPYMNPSLLNHSRMEMMNLVFQLMNTTDPNFG